MVYQSLVIGGPLTPGYLCFTGSWLLITGYLRLTDRRLLVVHQSLVNGGPLVTGNLLLLVAGGPLFTGCWWSTHHWLFVVYL